MELVDKNKISADEFYCLIDAKSHAKKKQKSNKSIGNFSGML